MVRGEYSMTIINRTVLPMIVEEYFMKLTSIEH
jgi:hypothetical protein